MTLPPRVRATVAAFTISGAVTLGVAAALAPSKGVGPAYELVPLTILLAIGWAFPLLVLRTEETEAFQLDEAFFVAMALLLPVPGTIAAFFGAVVIGNCVRRRPLVRAAFNTGQTITAVGLGLVVMRLITSVNGGSPRPLDAAAAVAGAAVFLLVNTAAVSLVISLNEHRRAIDVVREGLDLRVLVWAGGTALGLLAAIGGAAQSWALILAAIPMAALNLVLREHAHARRQSQRAEELFAAAGQIHASVALPEVEAAVTSAAMSLLRCRRARIGTAGPGAGELGVPIPDSDDGKWLIVAEPVGFEQLGETERDILLVVAGIAARAMQNAGNLAREQKIREDLEELNRIKSDFVSSVSHELRTPLTSILGYAEILCDGFGGDLSPEQARMLGIVGRNAERLLGLIEELLLMASLESGTLKLSLAPVSVPALLNDVYQAVVPELTARALDVVVDVAPDLDTIVGDPRRLDRALLNLLTNAIKFSPDGGQVRLSARSEGAFIRVEVADTGIGIPLEDQAKIFDRFFRSSSASHLAVPGTGLGLSITKMIVEGHGGRIGVSSYPGKGTVITIQLPREAAGQDSVEQRPPIAPVRG
jgi:signal transduction histidine kinase